VIKKIIEFLYKILGLPYYAVINLIKGLYTSVKLTLKGIVVSLKWSWRNFKKLIKKIPSMLKFLGKWIIDAIKESIAQIFTLLGFFIAWFTLTGTAQDIVGIAIIASIVIWLLTIYIRD
tara:strand:- start:173 stop:529 length:357 start_codon:yes stop_codon:yes gene_type:complete